MPNVTTPERILDEAERLFAQRGLAGVSLREIAIAASQRNNGAVQYHFGDKEGLVRAVFGRRAAPIDQRRFELLGALETPELNAVVEAYVEPLADQVVANNWYIPFLSRLQAEHRREELLVPASTSIRKGYNLARTLLRVGPLSHLPPRAFSVRWRLAVNLAIDALADHQLGPYRGKTREFRVELVDAITGLLSASSG